MTPSAFADVTVEAGTVRAVLARDQARALCAGHFPDEPLVPGAYVAGLLSQLASRLLADDDPTRRVVEVVRCVFLHPIRPDADVCMTARRDEDTTASSVLITAEVEIDGRCAARALLRFA